MGIDKTHDAIKTKYYWANMFKNLYQQVNILGNLSDKKPKKGLTSSTGNTDAPPYPFAKLGLKCLVDHILRLYQVTSTY